MDALLRLESMVLLSGFEQLPLQVIRTWIKRSVDIVIQQKRFPDGSRKITEISAVNKSESESDHKIEVLFTYENNKFIKNAKAIKNYLSRL
jgi:Flp pilus assembly CpaF family ATPase